MSVFSIQDYKRFLKSALEIKKKKDSTLSFSKLADYAKIQRSYLSQVLNGAPHLSADQLYLIAKRLGLGSEEIDYLLLLLEIERCTVPERQAELALKRDQIRAKHLKTEKFIKHETVKVSAEHLTQYYCDPHIPIAHMFLTIPKFQKNPEALVEKLDVSQEQFTRILSVLEDCGLIRFTPQGLEVLKPNLHLEKESPLARVNGTFFRLKAIDSLQRAKSEEDYFFTASFSATEALRTQIKERFLQFLKRQSKEIGDSPAEQVFQLNFDLFRI
ncbi:TIGR02147 family protein [Bdellovibrionota bacterium FG-2]